MHKTTLYLPVELERRLRVESSRTGRSQADLVREALSEYLGQRSRELPGFFGMGDDADLTAPGAKSWVRSRWSESHTA